MKNEFAFEIALKLPYEAAVQKTTAALKEEGFGVLTQIDVKATLKDKLGEDIRPYTILGACNPPLAHKAIESDPLVGVLLPCNVTVRETEGGSMVAFFNPSVMAEMKGLRGNPGIHEVAEQARQRLVRVAQALGKESNFD